MRNPFLLSLVSLGLAIVCCLASCVKGIVCGQVWLAIVGLILSLGACGVFGYALCKFLLYRQVMVEQEKALGKMTEMIEKMKALDSEPFKEFESKEKDNGKS